MLDYQAIAALSAVIETQSFQQAAEKLFITQSAISQRIKALENFYGQPVLIRTRPYHATPLGTTLLSHYQRVLLLEGVIHEKFIQQTQAPTYSVAISRDSLETWFVPIINQLNKLQPFTLKIIADDEELTLDYLQNGIVSACASTASKALSGGKIESLGHFDYALVASPAFKKKFFPGKITADHLVKAPTMLFDHKDTLATRYLAHFFQIEKKDIRYHVIPSVQGFKQFALNGYAYALIPVIDIKNELKQGELINLLPHKRWQMPMYWHTWSLETKTYQTFNELVIHMAKTILAN